MRDRPGASGTVIPLPGAEPGLVPVLRRRGCLGDDNPGRPAHSPRAMDCGRDADDGGALRALFGVYGFASGSGLVPVSGFPGTRAPRISTVVSLASAGAFPIDVLIDCA